MVARVRSAVLAGIFVALTLAGCLGSDPGERIPDPDHIGPQPAPLVEKPALPACTLQAGDIAFPNVQGAPRATGSEATIMTDAYGVSHIYADDAYSLWYANGFVQARDRLVQLDILRQVGYGESAKHLGPGQLGSDFEVHRTLYTREELQAQYDAAPAAAKEVIQAYSDGVNRFMVEAIAQDALPAEFAALGRVPPPWQPLDSVAIIDYLIGFFGVDGGQELANLQRLAQLQQTLGEDAAWDAFGDMVWLRSDDTYTTISIDDRTFNGCEDPLPRGDVPAAQLAALAAASDAVTMGAGGASRIGIPGVPPGYFDAPDRGLLSGFKWGSNAMLLDGSHSATGRPIMWGAPQMGYYKPPIPYQIGLHAPSIGYDAVGIGVAGAPGIVIGRNADLAWTATSGIEDQIDMVQLELAGPRSYAWDSQTRSMDCWTVEHQTLPSPGGNQDLPTVYEQEVCRAEGHPVVAINEDAGFAWMARSTTRNEELMGALIWLAAPTMHTLDAFRDLVGDFPFTFNFHVASRDGVAFIHTGNIPLRADGLDPRLPTPAGDAYGWRGEAYTREMDVWATDPARGYFANWNNAPGHGWRAGDQATLWGPAQRVQQIEYWMQQRLDETGNAMTWQDVADVNWLAATHDSYALPFLPHLITAAVDLGRDDVATALRDWQDHGAPWRDDDGDGHYDDPAHAVWDAAIQPMFDRITGDELGTLTKAVRLEPPQAANNGDHGTLNNGFAHLAKILSGTAAHDWCDDVTSPAGETCRDTMQAAMTDAIGSLQTEYGEDVALWLHPLHHDTFLPLGASEADRRPMINKGSWVQVVSMAEPERSASVLPPGNSGLVTVPELAMVLAGGAEPPRLTSELDLYWSGQFKPFPLTASEVANVALTIESLVIL